MAILLWNPGAPNWRWVRVACLAVFLVLLLSGCRRANHPLPTPVGGQATRPATAAAQPTPGQSTEAVLATTAVISTLPAPGGPTPTAAAATAEAAAAQPTGASRLHGDSLNPAISADGRFVVYQSDAGDLVEQDLPPCPEPVPSSQPCRQVYLYDRQAGQAELISASDSGAPGNADSTNPAISADGRYVVFVSNATNLAAPSGGQAAVYSGVFVRDRQAGKVSLIVNGGANPSISADGRWVTYEKEMSSIYLYDRQTGQEVQISREMAGSSSAGAVPAGPSFMPVLSADGNWVAFWSWDGHLVPGDTKQCNGNGNCGDLFLYDRRQQTLTRIPMDESYGEGMSISPVSLSADGRYLAAQDVLYDQTTGKINKLEVSGVKLSADGKWLIYTRGPRVYVRGAAAGAKVTQVTVSSDQTPGNGILIGSMLCAGPPQCEWATSFNLSADGRYAVFDSTASNLTGEDGWICSSTGIIPHNCADIFVRDRQSGKTEWISRPLRSSGRGDVPVPAVTAKSLRSLRRSEYVQSEMDIDKPRPVQERQMWYLEPGYWRYDTKTLQQNSTANSPHPAIASTTGNMVWLYDPNNNTLTIAYGQLPKVNVFSGPPLYGPIDGAFTLSELMKELTDCYPQRTFLGAGDTIARRKSYVIYLGESKCKGAGEAQRGAEVIWVDQETLVSLRWTIQSLEGRLPLYEITTREMELNPEIDPVWFTSLPFEGATVIDLRK